MALKKAKAGDRCKCSGGPAHHAGPEFVVEGCWCPTCLRKPEAERCREFVATAPAVSRNVAPVGHRHPATAKIAAANVLPRTGSKRRQVFDWIVKRQGLTDDEIEYVTGWSHQSVSAARNTLMQDGLIEDSGLRRETKHGYDAIVWRATVLT